jgi:hypothetical protein
MTIEAEQLKAKLERVIAEAADALDIADNIIAINLGTDTPKEWNAAMKRVVKARAAVPQASSLQRPIDFEGGAHCPDCRYPVADVGHNPNCPILQRVEEPTEAMLLEALEPFAKAVEAIEVHDPDYPPHGAVLRASFDFWARHPGLNNDELVMRDSVRFSDLCRLRDIYTAMLRAAR